jgi:hypothetical protein
MNKPVNLYVKDPNFKYYVDMFSMDALFNKLYNRTTEVITKILTVTNSQNIRNIGC